MDREPFRFCPELFSLRTSVIDKLAASGFEWLSHFMSVDLLHDQYGVEVCGILRYEDADEIQELICEIFPTWKTGCLCFKQYGAEPGYKVKIFRDGMGFDAQARKQMSSQPEPQEKRVADGQQDGKDSHPHQRLDGPEFLL
jgi:hypothetical protein